VRYLSLCVISAVGIVCGLDGESLNRQWGYWAYLWAGQLMRGRVRGLQHHAGGASLAWRPQGPEILDQGAGGAQAQAAPRGGRHPRHAPWPTSGP
jgi:hypothetical protein